MSGWTPDEEGLAPEEADRALAGEYVLGLMDAAEARAFEARLGREPALRDLVARWTEDFAATLEEVPAVAPPAQAQEALMRRLFPEAVRPGFLWRLLPWLLGGAVAAGGAFIALNPRVLGRGFEPELQARIAAEDESLVVQASFDADTRQLRVERTAGVVPEGRDLELWFVRLEDGVPASTVSLGVLPREESGVIEVDAALAGEFPANALAVSVEPVGGSPTGQATGPVVALGPLTEL
jgi:anti-sigma-K factor RskA